MSRSHSASYPLAFVLVALVAAFTWLGTCIGEGQTGGKPAILLDARQATTIAPFTLDAEPIVTSPNKDRDLGVAICAVRLGGVDYVCLLKAEQFKGTPEWDPEKGAVPLSADKAIRSAKEAAFRDFGPSPYWPGQQEPITHWADMEVSLVRGELSGKYVWYYRVAVKRSVSGSSPGGPEAHIFVTLDGKAAHYVRKEDFFKRP